MPLNLFSFLFLSVTLFTAQAANQSGLSNDVEPVERIVLITLDTFRADHLKSYGYPRETAPFITSLANKGTLFKRFIASSALTSPAHATLFTSLYPLQHNLLKNGEKLDSKFITLPEVMKSAGFQTAGFASTDIHFKIGNMDQGFDVFDEMERPTPKQPKKSGKREQVVMVAKTFKYRPATKTVDSAIAWLERKTSSERFFLWVHLFDTHMPHQSPKQFINAINQEPADERTLLAKHLFEAQHVDFSQFEAHRSNNTIPRFIDSYDAEIRYIDSELRRLYQFLQTEGLNTNTLWVITADHGEGLGNHQFLGHDRNLYNEQLRIPLIFHFTSGKVAKRVVNQVVEPIDILPTLAELVGGDLAGQNPPIEGRSLLPLIQNNPTELPDKGALSYKRESPLPPLSQMEQESPFARSNMRDRAEKRSTSRAEQQKLLHTRKPKTEEEWKSQVSEKVAFQTNNYKYIANTLFADEFYDIAQDPYETNNLAGKGFKEEKYLRKKLMSEIKRLKKGVKANKKQKPLDEKTIKKLRSLGYIQ